MIKEFCYGRLARQRAAFLMFGSGAILAVLVGLLAQQWNTWELPARIFGLVLAAGLLGLLRTQLARLWFRCRIFADRIELAGLGATRAIAWRDIVQVQRVRARQVGGERRWVCTVYTRTSRNTRIPTYLFDDQLNDAEQAFRDVVRYTPHAIHP